MMKSLLARITGFDRVIRIMDKYRQDDPMAFLNKCNHLYDVQAEAINLPKTILPGTVFYSTHHSGALDFLTTYTLLADRAPNLKVVLNNELLKLEQLRAIGIGVHTLSTGKRNPEAKSEMINHLESGGCILIYPAGKVGKASNGKIQDFPWRNGISKVAQTAASQIIPVYVDAQNSKFFYLIRKLFPKLSMIFLLHALRSRKKETVTILFGQPILKSQISTLTPEEISKKVRHEAYQLPQTLYKGASLEN